MESGIFRPCTEGRAANMVQPISEAVVRAWKYPMERLVVALQLAGCCGRRWR